MYKNLFARLINDGLFIRTEDPVAPNTVTEALLNIKTTPSQSEKEPVTDLNVLATSETEATAIETHPVKSISGSVMIQSTARTEAQT